MSSLLENRIDLLANQLGLDKIALQNAIDNIIDDTKTSASDQTWSIDKIKSHVNGEVAALINGADVDSDTLKELADKITALAQADNGLVSATEAQQFTDAQKLTARENINSAKKFAKYGYGAPPTTNLGIYTIGDIWEETKDGTETGEIINKYEFNGTKFGLVWSLNLTVYSIIKTKDGAVFHEFDNVVNKSLSVSSFTGYLIVEMPFIVSTYLGFILKVKTRDVNFTLDTWGSITNNSASFQSSIIHGVFGTFNPNNINWYFDDTNDKIYLILGTTSTVWTNLSSFSLDGYIRGGLSAVKPIFDGTTAYFSEEIPDHETTTPLGVQLQIQQDVSKIPDVSAPADSSAYPYALVWDDNLKRLAKIKRSEL